jgi:hypothetical protein
MNLLLNFSILQTDPKIDPAPAMPTGTVQA